MQAETPTDLYANAGNAFNNSRKWHFPEHNFTLMSMWTEFYVHAVPVVDGKRTRPFDIHLDRLNTNWTRRLPELDCVVSPAATDSSAPTTSGRAGADSVASRAASPTSPTSAWLTPSAAS